MKREMLSVMETRENGRNTVEESAEPSEHVAEEEHGGWWRCVKSQADKDWISSQARSDVEKDGPSGHTEVSVSISGGPELRSPERGDGMGSQLSRRLSVQTGLSL